MPRAIPTAIGRQAGDRSRTPADSAQPRSRPRSSAVNARLGTIDAAPVPKSNRTVEPVSMTRLYIDQRASERPFDAVITTPSRVALNSMGARTRSGRRDAASAERPPAAYPDRNAAPNASGKKNSNNPPTPVTTADNTAAATANAPIVLIVTDCRLAATPAARRSDDVIV